MRRVCKNMSSLLVSTLYHSSLADYPMPSPKTFRENLKVTVCGQELEAPLPSLYDIEVYGTQDLKEELFVPPLMMDLRPLLEPVSVL